MEISSQTLVYAVCYGTIAVAVWRASVPFPVWFGFCLLEIPYSFMAARLVPAVDLGMLLLGLLACVECLVYALRRERAALVAALAISAIAVVLAASEMRWGVLPARHGALAGFAVLFATVVLLDWRRPLDCAPVDRIHLRLLCAWLVARATSSLAYDFYADEGAWRVAGWLFLLALAAIAAGYSVFMVRRDRRLFLRRRFSLGRSQYLG